MTNSSEDLRAPWIDDANHNLYFTTTGNYSMEEGLKGNEDDIIACNYNSLGSTTACKLARFWNGEDHGFDSNGIDGMSIGNMPAVSGDTPIEGSNNPVDDTVEFPGDDIDEPDILDGSESDSTDKDGIEQGNPLFMPMIIR